MKIWGCRKLDRNEGGIHPIESTLGAKAILGAAGGTV